MNTKEGQTSLGVPNVSQPFKLEHTRKQEKDTQSLTAAPPRSSAHRIDKIGPAEFRSTGTGKFWAGRKRSIS
jgi:hypothetical protein